MSISKLEARALQSMERKKFEDKVLDELQRLINLIRNVDEDEERPEGQKEFERKCYEDNYFAVLPFAEKLIGEKITVRKFIVMKEQDAKNEKMMMLFDKMQDRYEDKRMLLEMARNVSTMLD